MEIPVNEDYKVYYVIGDYYEYIGYITFRDNLENSTYNPRWDADQFKKNVGDDRFFESWKGDLGFILDMMTEEYLDKSRRRQNFFCGKFLIERESKRTGESYMVYNRMAKEGEPGYSDKCHAVPHEEPSAPKEMDEWVNHYQFNKLDDGTYEAELDEAWWWGGSHTDGGTLFRYIPDLWQDLPYEEFLEKVIKVAAAEHFLFTVEDLLACPGLKEFFGY